jgi:hypothetical protein
MMKNQMKLIERANAMTHSDEYLWLSNDISPWKSQHFIHVACEVPGAVNTEMSGTYISKVFDGPYNTVPLWKKEMDLYLNTSGYTPDNYFVYYTTCPRCAKKYRHNYIVLFAQV